MFLAASAAVMENIGTFRVLVCRHGRLSNTVKVRVETIDGSAVEGEDYQAVDEVLTFAPNETEKEIGITIVDDNQVGAENIYTGIKIFTSGSPTRSSS